MRKSVMKFHAVCQLHDGYGNSLCCDVTITTDKKGEVICPACGKELAVIPDTRFRALTPGSIERLRSGKKTVEDRYSESTVGQDFIDLTANYIIDTLVEEMVETSTEQIRALHEKDILLMNIKWTDRIHEFIINEGFTSAQLIDNPKIFANWLYKHEQITEEIYTELLKKEIDKLGKDLDDAEFLINCKVFSITNNPTLKKMLRKKMEN